MLILGAMLFMVTGTVAAQTADDVELSLHAVTPTLVADGESRTTLVAFLFDDDGNAVDDQRVRFTLREGNGTFEGADDRAVSVEGDFAGNGTYVAEFIAGETSGTVTVGATWLDAPSATQPSAEVDIDLVSANDLTLEVDDDTINANEEATVIAYLLDESGRPVANADIEFRIVQGSGSLGDTNSEGGRYAVVFSPGNARGETVIEASLPTEVDTPRADVSIEVLDASTLDATVFPDEVELSEDGFGTDEQTNATILVAARDGDGDLVRGLTSDDLVAQVIAGSGEVSGASEIFVGDQRSGVYRFTFTAGDTVGTSTVRIRNLDTPEAGSAEVDIETVTSVDTGVADEITATVFSDEPFYALEDNEALLVFRVADSDGQPVGDLEPDVELVEGTGEFTSSVEELSGRGSENTGLYAIAYSAASTSADTTARIRATLDEIETEVLSTSIDIDIDAIEEPTVRTFPPTVPASSESQIVIDIFDFEGVLVEDDDRYEVSISSGPGRIADEADNGGRDPDLVSDDNISSARIEFPEGVAADQDVEISVVDRRAAGFPVATATVRIGDEVTLRVFAVSGSVQAGQDAQIVAFVTDAFDRPVTDHRLIMTLESGSGQVLAEGRMFDDGGSVEEFDDPIADDGMYVGVVSASTTASGTLTLRVVDTTSPTQPSATVSLDVR